MLGMLLAECLVSLCLYSQNHLLYLFFIPVVPSLIVSLCSPISSVRKTSVTCIKTLKAKLPQGSQAATITTLIGVLVENAEELAADPEQLHRVLGEFFAPLMLHGKPQAKASAEAKSAKSTLKYLLQHLVPADTPSYVRQVILSSLRKVVTQVHVCM